MNLIRIISVSGILLVANLCSAAVENLRCEYLVNPLGIDAAKPRLSWIMTSSRRGEKQTAYQILVASSPKLLANDKGDLWDSGKVASDESAQIVYAGAPLVSRQSCFWKVRVWDSTAEVRYLVVPMRPAGTEGMDEAALAALVTRDSMIGTGLPLAP